MLADTKINATLAKDLRTNERSIIDETEDKIGAYGIGPRYLALQAQNVWVGLDLARGPDEDAY